MKSVEGVREITLLCLNIHVAYDIHVNIGIHILEKEFLSLIILKV